MKKGTILRTDEALEKYLKAGGSMKFCSVELRARWNPMRLIYGSVYYKVI